MERAGGGARHIADVESRPWVEDGQEQAGPPTSS
jgi:hypothetical protein